MRGRKKEEEKTKTKQRRGTSNKINVAVHKLCQGNATGEKAKLTRQSIGMK
jgi:hypothetical protein